MPKERFFPKDGLAITVLALTALFFAVVLWWPILNTFKLSLQHKYFAEVYWVGLDNFRKLFTDDPVVYKAFKNSAQYALMVVPAVIVIGLALSIAVNGLKDLTARGAFTSFYFVAYVVPLVAVAVVWRYMYLPNRQGLFNAALGLFGIKPVRWLLASQTALLSLAMLSIWKSTGYAMLIYLAGLQAIPEVFYEAARIDGANRWRQFTNITWPLLMPTTTFVAVMMTLGALMMFGPVYVMTGGGYASGIEVGGPNYATTTIVYYIYRNAFVFHLEGYASALCVILFVVMVTVSYLQFKYIRAQYEY
jgi:multiple sugar transport system permease protein